MLKIECEGNPLAIIQKHSISKFATKHKFKISKPKKMSQENIFSTLKNNLQEMHNGMHSK